ncbi:hypothetical protein SNOG_13184 [Parastagonospora nodorum SN15]|uniref:Uncharacterized protein n=1 Tax=Phaeosphaeria nodorum (strain SN15 / ATCC MYA-4574 / FGSC 10173) TaxID=321614 RepID=Q0U4Y0_PHANO|nr:hypothetical protein SNOG_13184 [Parastagonospora nodorum SN15]EAT79511.1 hypothetical protein SNOG_13184 [Parastagonospora nodorum SN15]
MGMRNAAACTHTAASGGRVFSDPSDSLIDNILGELPEHVRASHTTFEGLWVEQEIRKRPTTAADGTWLGDHKFCFENQKE